MPVTDSDETRLQEARQFLTGEHKESEKAKKLLLEIVQSENSASRPETLVWADIYLGYIEDRADNRQGALAWYDKALKVKGAPTGSLDIARYGLQKPLVWIRHLDSPSTPTAAPRPPPPPAPPKKSDGKASVTTERPTAPTLVTNLSAEQRRENFEVLWNFIDVNYAHFKLKSIDWTEVGRRYRARLSTVTGDDDFYLMMFHLVNELKDTHSWLENYRPPELVGVQDMPIDIFRGKPFVIGGSKAGWEVLSVDGMTVQAKMESLRPHLRATSSERAFQRQASRSLLAGNAGDPVTVELRSPEGQNETLTLKRGRQGRPPVRPMPAYLTRQKFVHFGRLLSGLGYIWIESFNGRQEIGEEFDRALEALRDTPGLLLDIRDNPGGFGHPEIVGRLLQKRKLVGITYRRNGPRHDDLEKRESYIEPSGKWQYTGPVALLINDVTGSASDLFASQLRSAGRVVAVGTTTHGNLSGMATYTVLPCGLSVRISNGYLSDAKNRPIEVNGNPPDVVVEPDVQDYLNGRDPILERATEIILKSLRRLPDGAVATGGVQPRGTTILAVPR